VPSADLELAFLKALFGGTEVVCHRNDDNTVMHAEVAIGDSRHARAGRRAMVASPSRALPLGRGRRRDLFECDCRSAASESEPEDKAYGHRNAGVVDRNGITWWIGAPVK
jgi:uncharacterized glyoxalase superfamily protein PhnB